jgi:uncharacterized membrane protein YfcA
VGLRLAHHTPARWLKMLLVAVLFGVAVLMVVRSMR